MDIRLTGNTATQNAGTSGVKLEAQSSYPGRTVDPAAQKEAVAQSSPGVPAKEEVKHAVASINDVLKGRAPGLEFTFDKDDARLLVKVVDRDTGEVIRQMPSREAVEIAKALDKLQSLLAKQSA